MRGWTQRSRPSQRWGSRTSRPTSRFWWLCVVPSTEVHHRVAGRDDVEEQVGRACLRRPARGTHLGDLRWRAACWRCCCRLQCCGRAGTRATSPGRCGSTTCCRSCASAMGSTSINCRRVRGLQRSDHRRTQALRSNVQAFTGRLREIGFYRDLSDAYVTQTVVPRYTIAERNRRSARMSQGLRELTNQELNAALESVLLPKLSQLLAARELGHCMRVTDLDRELMIRLAGGLRAAVPAANVVVLADEALRAMAPDWLSAAPSWLSCGTRYRTMSFGPHCWSSCRTICVLQRRIRLVSRRLKRSRSMASTRS
jgi:hypothetical protein